MKEEEHEGKNDALCKESAMAYRALVPGKRYRVYYIPRSKKLVSIEPLP